MLIAVVVVAFISSWKLTLVIIIFLPLMVGMGFIKAKIDRGFAMIEKGSLEQAGQVIIVDSKAKIRNRHNQVPYLARNTICKRDKNNKKPQCAKKLRGQPFPNK